MNDAIDLAAPAMPAIDHVAVAVRDADEAARAFARLLGWHLAGDELIHVAGVRLVFLAPAGHADATQLQLVQPVGPGAVASFVTEHGEGLHHVCFRTPDIAAALHTAGERTLDGIFRGGRGRPCAFLTTMPHGARIELTEVASLLTDAGGPERGSS